MSANDVDRYGDWEVRRRERTLRVRGQLQKIGGRAFDVLLALIDGGDQVVRKADLLDAAWPGLVVEENNLSVQISTLRRLLGPSAIVNVAGLGYRLAATPAPDGPHRAAPPNGAAAPRRAADLIGRDDEIAALLPRLATAPLITVVGTGGVGKSSLARALLASTGTAWRDGVHWIGLEALRPGTDLLALVCRSLGVVTDDAGDASGDVLRSLAQFEALVVLDNCEHLLTEVAACVAPLLHAASAIQWLATSQEPLRLAGEEVFRLLPLHVAPADVLWADALSCDALSLFRQRAHAADRTFALDATNAEPALALCRALDGLPLAIEMAAARVATLGLRAVHAQLQSQMGLRSGLRNGPGRHHTLRDAYAWSYGLLSPLEQRVFRALQAFEGGFTAALFHAAVFGQGAVPNEANGIDPDDVLVQLVDKSLVQKMPAGPAGAPTRYTLLESARQFAQIQLESLGEAEAVHARHAEVVASWFDSAEHDWLRWRDVQWSAHYLGERGNVVAAAAWACDHGEPELVARLVAAAAELEAYGQGDKGLVKQAVPLDRLRAASPARRARACSAVGWAHFLDGDRELGTNLLEQALADYTALGDEVGLHLALTRLVRLYRGRPGRQSSAEAAWSRLQAIDPSSIPLRLRIYAEGTVARHFDARVSVPRLMQLRRLAQQAGFDAQAVICLVNMTDELLLQGRHAETVEATDGVLLQGGAFLRLHASVVHNRALALVRLGRTDEAHAAARQVLRAVPGDAHMVMDLFALSLALAERFDDAALLAGRSAWIKRERDCSAEPAEAAVIDDTMRALRAAPAAEDLGRLLELGASMSSDDVLAIVDLA